MNKILPCKIKRCLKYPLCISKKVISCDVLRDHYAELREEIKRGPTKTPQIWDNLRIVLPNLKGPIDIRYARGRLRSTSVNETKDE